MNVYLILALILLFYMITWYLLSIKLGRMDVADTAWGLGFPLLSWSTMLISGTNLQGLVVNILISIWGIRLATHIHKRNHNKPEDERYAEWRRNWSHFYLRSFFQVFALQGVLLYIIALPAITTNIYGSFNVSFSLLLGIVVWIVGFFFEAVGDKQLAMFIRLPENKGKIMQEGLWRYSRHPNYFGEVTMWWGIFLCGLGNQYALFTIIGPITITFLILYVSGIPLLEKRYANNPEYTKYKQQTSIFFPLPPRRS